MNDGQSLSKNYDPASVEPDIYGTWLADKAFHAVPDSRPADKRYVIMMPLPNVTGALHMGHAMDNVMQDMLVRWHRMMGDNSMWMPGTDHAGIATQAVVEKRLKELEGLTRHDLGREKLVERIWEWKDQYQERIIAQQQRMGCGCDWDRHRFTMDAVCARAVRHCFFRMFKDALIFRGKRLVNWDVYLQTSVSDDEVYHETVPGHFWHLRYPIIDPKPGEPAHVIVATTRPETMLGDTAVAVHPDPAAALDARIAKAEGDEADALRARKAEMLAGLEQLRDMARDGRKVRLPLMEREIPLICDEWAKPELGSGCVKITPAHDPNDYDVWKRHSDHIGIINILNVDGTLNDSVGAYAGLDRFEARERVVADFETQGLLEQIEDRDVDIGHSDRSKTPVEPYLSDQWFVHMADVDGGIVMGKGTAREHRAAGLVQAAMDAVTDGRVSIHPERYTKTYLDWLSEKRDWPVSRQLWWGHRIPVWSKKGAPADLNTDELSAIAGDPRVAIEVHKLDELTNSIDVCLLDDDERLVGAVEALGFVRDPDVLDTWFSSALWPFSTLGWPDPATAALNPGQPSLASGGGGDLSTDDMLEYFYPGGCLVTGRDIITLWVARMVLGGLYCVGDIPFKDVFIHANILDGKGERMSKSKGNGIDPVDIINQYGTDAMRYVLCDMQTGTQDIRLPVTAVCPTCENENDLATTPTGRPIFVRICKSCKNEFDVLGTMPDIPAGKLSSKRFEIGRGFCTKLWNSARFAFMNLEGVDTTTEIAQADLKLEDRWILDGLNQTIAAVQAGLLEYNASNAINAAREFFWSSLCDWYLELAKPRFSGEDAESGQIARRVLAYCLDQVLRLFHPFVPFITEFLYQELGKLAPTRGLGDWADLVIGKQLITAEWPTTSDALDDADVRALFAMQQEGARAVREVRSTAGISPALRIDVTIKSSRPEYTDNAYVMQHAAGIGALTVSPDAVRPSGAAVRFLGSDPVFVHGVIDDAEERARLEKAKGKLAKEIGGCEKKLGNPGFVARAPAHVVEEQKARLAKYRKSLEEVERLYKELT